MVDVSNRSRVPAGRREGGRFASEADGPSDGVADISGSGEYDATGVRHFAHRSDAVEAALQSDSPCYLTASGDGFDLAADPTKYRDPIYVPYDQDGDLVTEEIDFGGRPHDGWIVNPDEGMDGDMRPVMDFLDGKADSLTIRRETTDSVIWGDDEGEDETLDGETIILVSNRPPETAIRESFKDRVNGFDRFEAEKAVYDRNATKAELHWAAENANIDVAGRLAVSANAARLDPEESDRLLERVLRTDREAAGLAVQQLNLPENSKLYLAESPDPALRAAVAKRRDLPKEAEALLMRDPDDHVRAALVPHLGGARHAASEGRPVAAYPGGGGAAQTDVVRRAFGALARPEPPCARGRGEQPEDAQGGLGPHRQRREREHLRAVAGLDERVHAEGGHRERDRPEAGDREGLRACGQGPGHPLRRRDSLVEEGGPEALPAETARAVVRARRRALLERRSHDTATKDSGGQTRGRQVRRERRIRPCRR